ncbi:tubulin-specific chaperone D isoform X1 [Aricia agestis]|uniref:tubulin-specific chaperone D isoform X1 n=1 Tax=Aricia agestis TaxID=91739 RepID=UPI001C20B1C5|nr:tubulin-specific chaperone D isoform X1 [Aricia agestis]
MVGLLDGDINRDDDCDNTGLGCALEHFSEVEEVLGMIDNVKNIYNSSSLEVEYDKLYTILKQYYEQPHLLDPHLEKILAKFMNLVKDKESPFELKHATFNYMYQIIRVRGYKVVVRHLPHEVSDLLTVLTYLEAQDPNDKETWRSRFVLLLWLSIVVIIPFHMSRLDGFAPDQPGAGTSKKLTVMERIYNICKMYALSKDSCAEASAYLASKFLIRSDVKELYMGTFFDWACDLHSNLKEEFTIHYGVLAAVAAVLKHGKRDDLLPYASKLLTWVTKQNYEQHKAMLVRKYGVKIVQRIGLTFLKPRVATWRYTRGSRSLAVTLSGGAAAGDTEPIISPADDDDQDIPQEVEDVVELLLCSLRDDDTVVRWSAAKGVGRIGARLPALAAADVCESVLALFAEHERDTAWHGACMALAELGRRGLLSPAQLGACVRCAVRALARDEARAGGGGGGGRAARDAACHVAWALARAYHADALAPHAHTLANALIATACFDREINCRRAASAAYQENVGRHGMFPHGIDVLTTADFQTVGPRTAAYLVVAPQVARYPEYTQPLIDHLVDLKVEHWDCAIRELAAKALHKLTDKMPEYVATEVLPKLLRKIESIDLNVRHGAILAIGEVIHALSLCKLDNGSSAASLISEDARAGVCGLVGRLRARQQLRGLGGELMRQAACHAVGRLALAHHHVARDTADDWLRLIEECLAHEVQAVREKAIEALPLIINEYLKDEDDETQSPETSIKEQRRLLIDHYLEQLSNTGVNGLTLRMGFSRAIGSLPGFILNEHLERIVDALIECTKVTENTQKWAEGRRDAVLGLTEICRTLGPEGAMAPYIERVLNALLASLGEYTVDLRGDIGAWVREASMTGLLSICRQCAVSAPELLSAAAVRGAACGAAQQAVEKIDRTRAHAGRIFISLLYNEPEIPHIPHHDALKRIFPSEEVEIKSPNKEAEDERPRASENSNVVLWLFPGHTMPRFVQLLKFDTYRYHIVKGLVVSAGELTESLVKHTTQSLFSYLRSLHDDKETLKAICDTIIDVFRDNLHVKRIMTPMFNFLDRLFSSGAISPILEDPESTFALDVLKYLQLELRGGNSVYKMLDSINVLCQLIQVGGSVSARALSVLCVRLCCADRYVRRCAAARLYEALTLYGDVSAVPPDNLDQVMSILADTDWEKDVNELRPIRNEICDLMDIKRPVPKAKAP